MMQPRSPQSAGAAETPAATTAAMMEPARRKRKRPTPTTVTPVAAEKHGSGSETEEEEKTPQLPTALRRRTLRTSESDEDERKSTTTTPTATTTTSDGPPTRGPFRGKCLYQSRKCENERALKRNGKPHNLCDEHRNKQNQHQRKFDAKKYTRKKRKGSGSDDDGDDDDGHDEEERQEAADEILVDSAKQEHKPSARGKTRAGAAKPKRGKISPASSVAAAVAAMPSLSSTSPTVAYTAQYNSAYYRPVISPTHHDARPLEIRRPPALHVHRSSPPSMGLGLPPVHHIGSPPVPALGNVVPVDRRSPPYANRDMFPQPTVLVPPVTPVDHLRQPFPFPYGATAVYPFLRPPPPPARSRSFDSGVTRISPMGGAAPGAMGQQPFALGHPMGNFTPDQSHTMPPPSSSLGRPDKLPSLQQLPLGQLTRSRSQSHHIPFAQTYPAPTEHAYPRQSPPLHHQLAAPRSAPQTAQLLPSLGSLPPFATHRSTPSTTSPQQHQRQTPRGYHHQRPDHPY